MKKIADRHQTNPIRRILVVEDEPDIRQFNVEVLTECGYQVDVAETGLGAWQSLNSHRYDLLINNDEIPGATGVELLEKLHEARIPLPVIMVMGILPPEHLLQRPWLKIHAMLFKPYGIAELLAKVKQVLPIPTSDFRNNYSLPDRQGELNLFAS